MEQAKWKIPAAAQADLTALLNAGYTPLLSAVLSARGISARDEAERYLGRDLTSICDPFALADMDKAVARIELAIGRGEKIAVYGDYDADGITASCLLCDYLRKIKTSCQIYIPDRIEEGYGVNAEALELLHAQGVGLLITVDCGITAAREVEFAGSLGLDMIITDHHECQRELPAACAVINPKRHAADHPGAGLAGVGVAFKLACALAGGSEEVLNEYADLIALGTVADVMPLTGENRALVYCGLEKLRENPRAGLAALLAEAGINEKPVTATVIGFSLAPRINAAGRLCRTSKAIDLLMCTEPRQAQELARELCELNRRRQELELEVWQESMAILAEKPPELPIVLAGEHWHTGVAGIAASRLAEEFKLPAIMICIDGDMGKGSCRSYGDFNLFEALSACSEHLVSFGGHTFAAGLNVRTDKIDDFRRALGEYYLTHRPESFTELEPELLLKDFSLLDMEGVESLEELEPCGSDNPKPLICVCDVRVESISEMSAGKHLRLKFGKSGQSLEAVYFSQTADALGIREGDLADICFIPQINEFRSRRNVQLLMSGLRPSAGLEKCRHMLEKQELCAEDTAEFSLTRQDIASVWRGLKANAESCRIKLSDLFSPHSFENLPPETICLSLRVLAELSLLDVHIMGNIVHIDLHENGEKASLEDSPLFRQLSR